MVSNGPYERLGSSWEEEMETCGGGRGEGERRRQATGLDGLKVQGVQLPTWWLG